MPIRLEPLGHEAYWEGRYRALAEAETGSIGRTLQELANRHIVDIVDEAGFAAVLTRRADAEYAIKNELLSDDNCIGHRKRLGVRVRSSEFVRETFIPKEPPWPGFPF